MDPSTNVSGLTTEQKAIPRGVWTDERIAGLRAEAAAEFTDERIAGLRAEAAAEFTDERSSQLVAALDEMVLLRGELTAARLGQPPQERAPVSRKEALERLAAAWRACLDVHLRLGNVTKDAPACAALPGMWWATIGNALLKASWDEESVPVLATVVEGMLLTGVLPPGDVREMLDNIRANAARKDSSGG